MPKRSVRQPTHAALGGLLDATTRVPEAAERECSGLSAPHLAAIVIARLPVLVRPAESFAEMASEYLPATGLGQ